MPFIKKQQLISLESTTYPGTTDEIILPLLKKKNFIVGKDVYLSFSPERIDPAIRNISIKDIPKITSGVTPKLFESELDGLCKNSQKNCKGIKYKSSRDNKAFRKRF